MAKAAAAEKPKPGSAAKPGAGAAGGATNEPAGMDKGELKRILKHALSEPVYVAFALGADGKAIVVADRRKPPRALEKELKDAAPDSKNHRFGTAAVSPEEPKLVRFTVNKAANGMGRKLAVALKGTGFSKVELGSEDGAPAERAEEKDEEDASAAAAGAAASGAAGAAASTDAGAETAAGAGVGTATEAAAGAAAGAAVGAAASTGVNTAAEAGVANAAAAATAAEAAARAGAQAGARQAAPPDAGQLVARLTPKVRQMLEVVAKDPAQKAPLQKLATAAQATLRGAMLTLKPEDLGKASADIDAFCKAVDGAATAAGGAAQGAGVAAVAAEQAGRAAAQDAKQPSAQQVTDRLTQVVKRAAPLMQAGAHPDPAHAAVAAQAKQHLTQAHAALKEGDLAAAGRHTDELDRLAQAGLAGIQGAAHGGAGRHGAPTDGAANGVASGAAVGAAGAKGQSSPNAFVQVAQQWERRYEQARHEAGTVVDHVRKAFGGHGRGKHIVQGVEKGVEIAIGLGVPGVPLARTLYQLGKAASEAEHAKLVSEARALVKRHLEHINTNPLLMKIEGNPHVPVKIRQHLVGGLQSVNQALSLPFAAGAAAAQSMPAAKGAEGRRP